MCTVDTVSGIFRAAKFIRNKKKITIISKFALRWHPCGFEVFFEFVELLFLGFIVIYSGTFEEHPRTLEILVHIR